MYFPSEKYASNFHQILSTVSISYSFSFVLLPATSIFFSDCLYPWQYDVGGSPIWLFDQVGHEVLGVFIDLSHEIFLCDLA